MLWFACRWTIRARVTNKSNIRTWSNSRGEGKLFSINLLDESGEIRATLFKSEVDKFYDMIELNKVSVRVYMCVLCSCIADIFLRVLEKCRKCLYYAVLILFTGCVNGTSSGLFDHRQFRMHIILLVFVCVASCDWSEMSKLTSSFISLLFFYARQPRAHLGRQSFASSQRRLIRWMINQISS